MKTTTDFLNKLSKINFDKIESRNEFSGEGFSVLLVDKITPEGATITINLKYEGKTFQTWGAWDQDAIEVATWRAKQGAKINRNERELEAIAEALAKKKFKDL